MADILTVFYSLKGETIAPGMKIVNLEKGHTAVAAEFIQKAVGGDLFELETVKTYVEDHMKMIYSVTDLKAICTGAQVSDGGHWLGHEVDNSEEKLLPGQSRR